MYGKTLSWATFFMSYGAQMVVMAGVKSCDALSEVPQLMPKV